MLIEDGFISSPILEESEETKKVESKIGRRRGEFRFLKMGLNIKEGAVFVLFVATVCCCLFFVVCNFVYVWS